MKHLICLIFTALSITASGQSTFSFLKYLNDNELYDDILQTVGYMDLSINNTSENDSLYYYLGLAYYHKGLPLKADSCFKNVLPKSCFYSKACLYNYLCLINTNQFNKADSLLNQLSEQHLLNSNFIYTQKKGILLLKRDTVAYNNLNSYNQQKPSNGTLTNIEIYHQSLANYKNKSPLLAGLLSAVVPGLGKVYSGKPKQGLFTFLATSFLSLQAYEYYQHKGFKSPGLYIFGSIACVFYIGNIWGSSLSVKINQQEFNEQINQNIIFDLRIPVNALLQ